MKSVVSFILLIFVSSIAFSQRSYDSLVRFDELYHDMWIMNFNADSIIEDKPTLNGNVLFHTYQIYFEKNKKIEINKLKDSVFLYRYFLNNQLVEMGELIPNLKKNDFLTVPLLKSNGEDSILPKLFHMNRNREWISYTNIVKYNQSQEYQYYTHGIKDSLWESYYEHLGIKFRSRKFKNDKILYDSLYSTKVINKNEIFGKWYIASRVYPRELMQDSSYIYYMLYNERSGHESFFDFKDDDSCRYLIQLNCYTGSNKDDYDKKGRWGFDAINQKIKILDFELEILFFNGKQMIVRKPKIK